MDIKNDRTAFPTDSVLSKLSKYIGESKEKVLFDILEAVSYTHLKKKKMPGIAFW